jgi:hypothetical protein
MWEKLSVDLDKACLSKETIRAVLQETFVPGTLMAMRYYFTDLTN